MNTLTIQKRKKPLSFYSILFVVLAITLILLITTYDNSDNRLIHENIKGTKYYVTSTAPTSFLTRNEQKSHHGQDSNHLNYDQMRELLDNPDQICANLTANSTKEQLLSFVEGPCSPVVVIPGIEATKLSVLIDCETLQEQNPGIFSQCGWNTCNSWNILGSKPNSEYLIWISDLVSPVSLLFPDTALCFGELIQLEINPNATDLPNKYVSPAGVSVQIYGTTPETSSDAECGFGAIIDLLPFGDGVYQTSETKGWISIEKGLISMGYQRGLTLFAMPYDFRLTTKATQEASTLKRIIEFAYELTGKKIIVIAHSLGNFAVLNTLNGFTSEEKAQYIAAYIAITPPYNGSPKAVGVILSGDKEYYYSGLGLDFVGQKYFLASSTGFFESMPGPAYNQFANEPWMAELKLRIAYENQYNISTDEGKAFWESLVQNGSVPVSWFPTPLNNCSLELIQRPDECLLLMYDMYETPLATILNQTFNTSIESMTNMFENYVKMGSSEQILAVYNDSLTNDEEFLKNPEVPIVMIYGSHLNTEKSYSYSIDPTTYTSKNEFAPMNISFTNGDETVPVSAALIGGIKWAWEHTNAEALNINAQPVKIVEYCSIYNNKHSVYDSVDDNGVYTINTNEYIGVQCACATNNTDGEGTIGDDCSHASTINDPNVVALVQSIVYNNQTNPNYTNTQAYILTEAQIENLVNTCQALYAPANVTNIFRNMNMDKVIFG